MFGWDVFMGARLMEIAQIRDDYTIDDWAGHAVMSLTKGSEVNIGVKDGKLIHWELLKGDIEKPTEKEIADEVTRLKAVYASLEYSRNRKAKYPPIGDQLDALWKGGADADAMKIIVNKVKTDNPKE